jgi:putative intracellular protease/amidase
LLLPLPLSLPSSPLSHGPNGLVSATDANGDSILKGRNVTGFSDAEERAVGAEAVVPFLLETKMKVGCAISAGEQEGGKQGRVKERPWRCKQGEAPFSCSLLLLPSSSSSSTSQYALLPFISPLPSSPCIQELGGIFSAAPELWHPHAVRDGNLVGSNFEL